MRVKKNLLRDGSKIHATEIVVGDKNDSKLLPDSLDNKFDLGNYRQDKTYGYVQISSGNADTILRHGVYFVIASGVSNLPVNNNGWLKVMCSNDVWGVQEYISQGSSFANTHRRFLSSGTWGNWVKLS